MATYLWVGKKTDSSSTIQQKVDQYCFNAPGNWMVLTGNAGSQYWATTSNTPNASDSFYIGIGSSADVPNTSTYPFSYPGYTHAHSPCLFGGYSGGVYLGTWSHTNTASFGSTYTSAMSTAFIYPDYGYNFPYVGGGISGDIARWCAYRDGISASSYTASNSSGFRDPSKTLRLKVTNDLFIISTKIIQPSVFDENQTPEYHTAVTKTIIDLEGVKALASVSAQPGIPAGVRTKATIIIPASTGLRLNGFYFDTLLENRGPSISDAVRETISATPNVYPYTVDYESRYQNIVGRRLDMFVRRNCRFDDCLFSKVDVEFAPRGVTFTGVIAPYAGPAGGITLIPEIFSTSQKTVIFNSNVNEYNSWYELYGVTGGDIDGIPSTEGIVNIDSKSQPLYSSIGAEYPNMVKGIGIGFHRPYGLETLQQFRNKRDAFVVGDSSNTNKIASIRKINLGVNSNAASFIPAALQFAGNAIISDITCRSGCRVESHPDISSDASVRIAQITLSKLGTLDLSRSNSNFDNWLIGGISGGSGSSGGAVYGGIVFADELGIVRGSENVRFWNTQLVNGVNSRQTTYGVVSEFSAESGLP
jgi:hypothetical protein